MTIVSTVVTAAVDVLVLVMDRLSSDGDGLVVGQGQGRGLGVVEGRETGGLALLLHLDDLVGLLTRHVCAQDVIPDGAKGLREIALDAKVLVMNVMAKRTRE